MNDISITRTHHLEAEDVQGMVQKLVDQLVNQYGGSYTWQGNCAKYNFSGVDARLEYDDVKVKVQVQLGFMMKAFKAVIQQEITDYMDKQGMTP